MNTPLSFMLVVIIFTFFIALLGARIMLLRRAYYLGIAFWSKWLAVIATGIYMGLMATNVALGDSIPLEALSLNSSLSTLVMTILFFVGPLFLTPLGGLIAAIVTVFLIYSITGSPNLVPMSLGMAALPALTTIIAVLGDRMPWLQGSISAKLAAKIRDILIAAISIGSIGLLLTALSQLNSLTHFVMESLDLATALTAIGLKGTLNSPMILKLFSVSLIILLMSAWLSIALGFTRHLVLPVISLPTLTVLAFMTSWSNWLLIIPFTACLALALAVADRRFGGRHA